ncbi:iron complex transport system substrate-binding protein [Thermocatellispora tengchongensis]|uniref:Iron complex transport system substrate-binding protein n=1 Tax=Thermocatellispora tengchongensis TaxID=1073253 RepID=A0A840P2W3_9ACTN|nr:ABC transporter substrate-binding protein [Thermocatellispora tengchongensis]MBB5133702.1 iron complex transport system substrate-binding protein [Thermocatellispora tengchongensis]
MTRRPVAYDATRRRVSPPRLGGVLLAAGALCLALAGCGGSGGDADAVSAKAATASTASSAQSGAFPVTIPHSQGETTVKSAPQRVVALSTMDLDAALSLGVTPVGAPKDPFGDEKGVSPWLAGKLTPATTLFNATPDISFEEIAALKPDLILATGDYSIAKHYAKLSQIAPTLAPAKSAAQDSWQGREEQVGTALGKADAAKQAVAETEDKIQAVADAHPNLKGKTFSVSYAYAADTIATISAPDDFAVKFMESLGLKVTPTLRGNEETATGTQPGRLSPEQADRLASDLTVIGFTSPQVRNTLEKGPAFAKVKSTGVYTPVDNATITELRNPSILGIPWLLEKLAPSFKAVK